MKPNTPNTTHRKDYNHIQYLHRYACWTAARAVVRTGKEGYGTLPVAAALTSIEIFKFIENPENLTTPYKEIHTDLVKDVLKNLRKKFPQHNDDFGIGAKIIAIYFKTTLILPALATGKSLSKCLKQIYPPIDRGVIQRNVQKQNFTWTNMNEAHYYELLDIMYSKQRTNIEKYGYWILDYEFNNQ